MLLFFRTGIDMEQILLIRPKEPHTINPAQNAHGRHVKSSPLAPPVFLYHDHIEPATINLPIISCIMHFMRLYVALCSRSAV